MNRFVLVWMIILLSGCSMQQMMSDAYDVKGGPGYVERNISEFDDVVTVKMEPAYLTMDYSYFKVGVYRSSRMKPGEVWLEAQLKGAVNFDFDLPMKARLGSEMLVFKPVSRSDSGSVSNHYVHSSGPFSIPVDMGLVTRKYFRASVSDLKKLAKSKNPIFRVFTFDGYVEEKAGPADNYASSFEAYPHAWFTGGIPRFLAMAGL